MSKCMFPGTKLDSNESDDNLELSLVTTGNYM